MMRNIKYSNIIFFWEPIGGFCCRQLKIDRGNFFHLVYRIERKLGKVFATLQPFPLYPVNEYFAGVITRDRPSFLLGYGDEDDMEERIAA